jgi:hypothetical protein
VKSPSEVPVTREGWWIVVALLTFLILGNLFVIGFVHQERYLYFWDYVGYWSKFDFLSHNILERSLYTLSVVLKSIREDDYNYFPSFLLMPSGLLFGTDRIVYILSIVNIFAFPAVILLLQLYQKVARMYGLANPRLALIAAAMVLLLPNFWNPILIGLPDVGGFLLIQIILWLYLSGPYAQQSCRNLLLMALLIPTMVLFRRWYAYWGVSFYAVVFIIECGSMLVLRQWTAKAFFRICLTLLAQGAISFGFLLTVARTFMSRAVHTNYADIYSAFRKSASMGQSCQQVVTTFGWFYLSLFAVGAILALVNTKTRKIAAFLLLQGLIIFVIFSRTQNFAPQHFYLIMTPLLLFSALWAALLLSRATPWRIGLGLALMMLLILNSLAMFYPNTLTKASPFVDILTGVEYGPHVRDDIPEIDRLLSVLEQFVTDPRARIYVLSASQTMNSHILTYAFLSLHRHEKIGEQVLWTHDVDKRDGFPQELLTAQYLVAADPIQANLSPKDQQILSIPARLVLKGEGIGSAFSRLPYEFHLDGDVKAYIYKKTRPFTEAELDTLSGLLRDLYPDRPFIYEIKR